MRELELDGIHDDGEHVILVDSDGERYTLRLDRALRAAVRADRPALNMIQATDSTPLRPREIQAMLRAGRTAEEISDASEIPLEHVRRYEGPVLAEREWTAQRARTFPVGRGGPSLLEVVTERLAAREATGETAWDAWRRQDSTWTLQLTFAAGGRTRQAHWVADIDNRSVSPVDDEARWINDEDAPPETARSRGRLQAVKSSVYDLEADGSLEGNTPAPRRSRPWPGATPGSEEQSAGIDDGELDALNARRGLRSVPRPDDTATVWSSLDEEIAEGTGAAAEEGAGADGPAAGPRGSGTALSAAASGGALEDTARLDTLEDPDAEALREHATEDADAPGIEDLSAVDADAPAPATEGAEAPEEGSEQGHADDAADPLTSYEDTMDLTPLPGIEDATSAATLEAASAGAAEGTEGDVPSETAEASEKAAKKRSRTKSRRASMPSWDEIVFGSKHE